MIIMLIGTKNAYLRYDKLLWSMVMCKVKSISSNICK